MSAEATAVAFLTALLPYAIEYVADIVNAQEAGDATLARRKLQEALERQAFEELQRAKRPSPRCAKCNQPKNAHHARHPFERIKQ